jgi:glycolate oxidase
MTFKTELDDIFGSKNVSNEPEVLKKLCSGLQLSQPGKPNCVVYTKNTAEVQKAGSYNRKHSITATPRSSSVGFYGAGILAEGCIILDLTRMNKILDINLKDRQIKVEPGVT